MRNPSYLLISLALLLVAACEPKRPVVSTEGGEQLTTESGDPLGTYTARLAPQPDAQ
jgi:hypothetical protein